MNACTSVNILIKLTKGRFMISLCMEL